MYSSSLNVQEYMVTISNKIIEDAVKAVREDCSMENIKWVDNIFYWFTWCEFECWFFRRLAETIKKYRPESMEVKNVRKLWSFQKWYIVHWRSIIISTIFFQLNKKTFKWARILTASLVFISPHIYGYMGSIFHFHFDFLQENIGYWQYLSLSVKNDVTQWP